ATTWAKTVPPGKVPPGPPSTMVGAAGNASGVAGARAIGLLDWETRTIGWPRPPVIVFVRCALRWAIWRGVRTGIGGRLGACYERRNWSARRGRAVRDMQNSIVGTPHTPAGLPAL